MQTFSNKKSKSKAVLITEGVVLALPLLITFVLYLNLVLNSSVSISDPIERFSPQQTEPLLIFMVLFIITYGIFLGFMYRKIKKEIDMQQKVKR